MPLRAYLMAIAIFANEVKGKSMLAMSRDLGTSYKTSFVLAHKLREAMACAVVPVVPALGDLPRLVRHQIDGLVYAPGDHDALVAALEMLIRNPVERERLARAARLASEESTWERVADLVLAVADRVSVERRIEA